MANKQQIVGTEQGLQRGPGSMTREERKQGQSKLVGTTVNLSSTPVPFTRSTQKGGQVQSPSLQVPLNRTPQKGYLGGDIPMSDRAVAQSQVVAGSGGKGGKKRGR